MAVQASKETIVATGEFYLTQNPRELLKALRIATSIVVVVYDPTCGLGGMAHMAMPDSHIMPTPGDCPGKYVDLGLPLFIAALNQAGLSKTRVQIKIIGGSQLFNFGGGSGNLLNIGTRNAITARTILTREGLPVEKTETGGNKPRTVIMDMTTGHVQVFHPGESARSL